MRGISTKPTAVTKSATQDPQLGSGLDEVDLAILAQLAGNARITGAALAKRVGIAESTCAKRMQLLREHGIITGFTTQMNLAALGHPIQAVIAVRLASHNRDHVLRFHDTLTAIPGVLTVFHVAGENDYLLHVAVTSPEELRDLVLEHVNVHRGVQHTETQLVFSVMPGAGIFGPISMRAGGALRSGTGHTT
ncbi:Lrp/AsnC family transcriptional regulator [Flexivirga caeni]|uniref:Lrp/AsnC family transcriptional regulator n=1 Tax=Flexivirga caeni TaxID=2294115 RepID=A0A3M9M787_9MICO|nr:Lrp/AsnC family transcriptional regulator [Flexivirga caeni]RNI20753.1 Lrp/AsnC family transcriptional regulator [Flexivirga caeni]